MLIRSLDIIISIIVLIIIFIPCLFICFVLKITGEGEIFFIQKRVGKDKKIFKVFKFATMLKNSPKIGTKEVTLKYDKRVLPVGRLLRKFKINELPQFLNVLLGDMSVIGPRPQTLDCFEAYPTKLQDIVAKMKPGISGIGSIVFCNEEIYLTDVKNYKTIYKDLIMPFKGELEKWYLLKKSITVNLLLILMTVFIIFNQNIKFVWKIFRDLPTPNVKLKKLMSLKK